MKTIRVCHVTSAHSRYDSRIFEKECVSLAEEGFEVYQIVCDTEPNEYIQNVHIVSTGRMYGSRFERMRNNPHLTLELAKQIDADIYHLHDPELLLIALKLKKMGKHVIFDSHERYAKQIMIKKYIPLPLRRVVANFYHGYESYVSNRIDAVVIPGERNDRTSFKGRSKRCVIIRNLPQFEKRLSVDIEKNLKKRVLFQAGSLTEERGITEMVIAGYRTNSKVLLAGDISDEYKEKLFSMKESECIEYVGRVKYSKVAELMERASIGVAVMHNVGQYGDMSMPPTKVLEYAFFGLPMIVSSKPDVLREFVEKNECGIAIDSQNIDEFVDAIQYMYDHPGKTVEMGNNGKNAMERDWTWAVDANRLVQLYRDIISD